MSIIDVIWVVVVGGAMLLSLYRARRSERRTTTMDTQKYPTTLSNSLQDFVSSGFNVNDTLECFQFLYSENKLSQLITWTMRANVLEMLVNNGAKRYGH